MYARFFKPVMDVTFCMLLLILALPLILGLVMLLAIFNNGEVFFVQSRVGKNLRVFNLYKFKTMNERRDERGDLLSDEKRLTKLGKLIRRSSLDELPQLINVIKQDMSLIGPRPLLPEYLPYYNEIQKNRHAVLPGITGLAQVNGRNLTTWERRLELDVEYCRKISFAVDFQILILTVIKVLKSEGVSPADQPTMPKFSDYIKQKVK
jgi:lipopolysaccharide/colanic/teichoic acid biosynthesis glycosyltransferase